MFAKNTDLIEPVANQAYINKIIHSTYIYTDSFDEYFDNMPNLIKFKILYYVYTLNNHDLTLKEKKFNNLIFEYINLVKNIRKTYILLNLITHLESYVKKTQNYPNRLDKITSINRKKCSTKKQINKLNNKMNIAFRKLV